MTLMALPYTKAALSRTLQVFAWLITFASAGQAAAAQRIQSMIAAEHAHLP
jgi:hypothetical protein